MQRIKKISTLTNVFLLLSVTIAASGGYLSHYWYWNHSLTKLLPYNSALLELNTALTYLGYMHYHSHTPQEQQYLCQQVIHHCTQSLAIEPSASAHYHMGIAWRIMGQPYQAMNAFEQARAQNKSSLNHA